MKKAMWLCMLDGTEVGPFTSGEVRDLVASGDVTRKTLIRKIDSQLWQEAGKYRKLFEPITSSPKVPRDSAEPGQKRFCPMCSEAGLTMDQAGFQCSSCGAKGDLMQLTELGLTFNFRTGKRIKSPKTASQETPRDRFVPQQQQGVPDGFVAFLENDHNNNSFQDSLDSTECVFCESKPRRKAVAICPFQMVHKVNLGTFKHQRIQTTTKTIPLPICSSCSQGMRTWTYSVIVCFLLCILFGALMTPVNQGEYLSPTSVVMFILMMATAYAPWFLAPLVRWHFGVCRIYFSPPSEWDYEDLFGTKLKRWQTLEAANGYGSLPNVSEIRNTYCEGYWTKFPFLLFIGLHIKKSV